MTSDEREAIDGWGHPRPWRDDLEIADPDAPTEGRPLDRPAERLGQELMAEADPDIGRFFRHELAEQCLRIGQPRDGVICGQTTWRTQPSVALADAAGEATLVEECIAAGRIRWLTWSLPATAPLVIPG